MKIIHRATLETCASATGLVVVIDVLRAFTTAAFLFAAGVEEITLVSTVEEALALKRAQPDLLLVGEVGGLPIDGFDFGNSPSAFVGMDLRGRRFVQRTSAGTQGVVRSVNAGEILLASLVVAGATLRYIQNSPWQSVTLLQTESPVDVSEAEMATGDEDAACGDLLADGLAGRVSDVAAIQRRVRASKSGQKFSGAHAAFPAADLQFALEVDRFDFVMRVECNDGLFVARAAR